MEQYKNLVFSICLRMTGDYFTAEDIAQETFLSAYMHIDQFDGSNEKAWLCRIAANKCTDYLRSSLAKTAPVSEEDMPKEQVPLFAGTYPESNNPADIYETEDIINSFTRCCKELPDSYSDIALQYFVEGKTAKEIAMARGDNLKTVQTRIYRAKEMLRKTYGKEWLDA